MENIIKKFLNLTIIEKLLLFFFILIIIVLICSHTKTAKEGFDNFNKELILKKDIDIYDDFYINIFDVLSYDKIITDFEVGNIISSTYPTEKSIILDTGSKNGYIVNLFKEITNQVIGIELSKNMIEKAIERYPHLKNNFLQEDILNNQLFENNSFTHIFSLNLNFYNIQNKKLFLENCFNWLIPGGCLALNLIDNPNLSMKQRIINIRSNVFPDFVDPNILLTESVKFKDFTYYPKYYMITDNKGILEEKFNFNNGNIRKQETTIYFMSINEILKIAKYLGFIVLQQFTLKNNNHNNNYLYILQKPN